MEWRRKTRGFANILNMKKNSPYLIDNKGILNYKSEYKRGGKRINAGRKKSEHKKVVLSFRVDERHAKELKIKIKQLIHDPSTPTKNTTTY